MSSQNSRKRITLLAFIVFSVFSETSSAQIGGKTGVDGVFVLDNAESLNLVASGVQRDWISDYATSGGLSALDLSGSGLTLASGQTPIGALRFVVPNEYGYLNLSYGVPMPSVPGASTATDPGDLTTFDSMDFLARFDPTVTGVVFQVVLETYPGYSCGSGPCYPRMYYNFVPTAGTSFEPVSINLWAPVAMDGPSGLTVKDRLSQTRFLSLYVYADIVRYPLIKKLTLDIDDIHLEPLTAAKSWELYR